MNVQNPYAAPTADLSAPGIQWMQGDLRGLGKTRLGLSLVYFGIVIILLSLLAMLLVIVFPPAAILGLVGFIVGGLMMFVGPLFCLSVPTETGAKGAIVGSVLLQLLGWMLALVATRIVDESGRPNPLVQGLGSLLQFIGFVLFVLFMFKLAQFIGRIDLAKRARKLLIALCVIFVLLAVVLVSSSFYPQVGFAFAGIAGVLMLVAFLSYANTVNFLRKALTPSAVSV